MPEDKVNPMTSPCIQKIVVASLFLTHDGHEKVGGKTYKNTDESRRCYSDDGKRVLIELDHTANHATIVAKTCVPVRIAQHHIGSAVGAMLVGGVEQTAKIWLDRK